MYYLNESGEIEVARRVEGGTWEEVKMPSLNMS